MQRPCSEWVEVYKREMRACTESERVHIKWECTQKVRAEVSTCSILARASIRIQLQTFVHSALGRTRDFCVLIHACPDKGILSKYCSLCPSLPCAFITPFHSYSLWSVQLITLSLSQIVAWKWKVVWRHGPRKYEEWDTRLRYGHSTVCVYSNCYCLLEYDVMWGRQVRMPWNQGRLNLNVNRYLIMTGNRCPLDSSVNNKFGK